MGTKFKTCQNYVGLKWVSLNFEMIGFGIVGIGERWNARCKGEGRNIESS